MRRSLAWVQVVVLLMTAPLIGIIAIASVIFAHERQVQPVEATTTLTPNLLATSLAIQTNPPTLPETRPTGIFDAGVDFWHEGFAMTTAWQQKVNGYWANVEVGTLRDDPEQGMLFSSWEFPNAGIGRFFRIPGKTGELQIVSEHNYRLTIHAKSGAILYFDIPSQSFVESLNVIIATITPPPTHTPTPTIAIPCIVGYPGYSEVCSPPTLPGYPD